MSSTTAPLKEQIIAVIGYGSQGRAHISDPHRHVI